MEDISSRLDDPNAFKRPTTCLSISRDRDYATLLAVPLAALWQ